MCNLKSLLRIQGETWLDLNFQQNYGQRNKFVMIVDNSTQKVGINNLIKRLKTINGKVKCHFIFDHSWNTVILVIPKILDSDKGFDIPLERKVRKSQCTTPFINGSTTGFINKFSKFSRFPAKFLILFRSLFTFIVFFLTKKFTIKPLFT